MRPAREWIGPALALALAACGDPKSPTEPAGPPRQHVVQVADFQFTPARLVIRAGDVVTWRNAGGFHNVRADDDSFRCAESCSGSGGDPSTALWSFARDFATPGTVAYHCEVHGGAGARGMSGEIVVTP